jgi:hypothetical protein
MSAQELLRKHADELAGITGLVVEVIQDNGRLFTLFHDYG